LRRLWAELRIVGAVVRQRWISWKSYPAAFYMWPISPLASLAVVMFMAKAFSTVAGGLAGAGAGGVLAGSASSVSAAAQTIASGGAVTGGAASDFRSFLLVSTVLWTYIEGQLGLGFSIESEMRRGTAEAVLITPASRWAFLTGNALYQFIRSAMNAIATVIFGIVCFGVSGFLGPNWARTLAIFGLDLLVVYGYGLVLAGALVVFRSAFFSYTWDCVLPLLAGSTFSVSVLPPALRKISLAIPLTHGLDLLRWSVSGYPTVLPPRTEAWVLGISAMVFPIFGYVVFAVLERVARARGTLGQF
jgi:ABC-type polysaccharide/polyol phosphate export permease